MKLTTILLASALAASSTVALAQQGAGAGTGGIAQGGAGTGGITQGGAGFSQGTGTSPGGTKFGGSGINGSTDNTGGTQNMGIGGSGFGGRIPNGR